MKVYRVHHEAGGYTQVFAENEDGAVEAYYAALEGILGHHLKICECFGEKKPIDRTKVARPTRVELMTKEGV